MCQLLCGLLCIVVAGCQGLQAAAAWEQRQHMLDMHQLAQADAQAQLKMARRCKATRHRLESACTSSAGTWLQAS